MKPMFIHSFAAINALHDWQGEAGSSLVEDGKIRALEPDYKIYIPDAGLRRRMSRVVKMGVAAALECLKETDRERIGAILTSTGWGCLGDTEKFMNSILDHDERLLNPTAFIQSTFNTIGAQIALLCKNHHYNMTYVHRGFSWESALLDARLWFAEGEAELVLAGAIDELTETAFRVQERMGYWKDYAAGEGAHFFVLGNQAVGDAPVLLDIETCREMESMEDVSCWVKRFLARSGYVPGEVDLILCGGREVAAVFPESRLVDYKKYCGEYPTSAAFAVWLGCRLLKGESWGGIPVKDIRRILIYNNFRNVNYSVILMGKTGTCGLEE